MTVGELKVILSRLPDHTRILVDVDDIVGSPKDAEVLTSLEEYPCAGFHDDFEDFEGLYNKKVVILR